MRELGSDPDAICVLYDRYVVRLVRFLIATGATREIAWDASQEVFARLLERGFRGQLREDGSLWPWLSASGRNLVRDWQRRGRTDDRARKRLGINPVAAIDEQLEALLDRLESQNRAGELKEALDALPAEQESALIGRVLEGLEYEQLAASSGATEQTVRRRVSRGLRAMRTRLQGG